MKEVEAVKAVSLISLGLGLVTLSSCSGGGGGGDPSVPSAQANRAPVLTSPTEAVFPQTRTGTAYTIQASDPDGDRLTYSISGDDASAFAVDAASGALSFVEAPDVDAPASVDGDNFYFIDVTVQDSSSLAASQQVTIEVARHDPQGPFLSRDGVVFLGPDTIVASDPSMLQSVSFSVSETRTIFDNRVGNDVSAAVNVYDAIFANGKRIEMVVNAEIASLTVAEEEAWFYANILGQLDPLVADGIDVVYINPGMPLMSAFPGGITVHTGWVENEVFPLGAVEEVMAHEAVHATLDPMYLRSSSWAQAQKADVSFVSEYARDFPETEDLAESYGAYLIVKNASRNPADLVQTIQNGIPERLVFFQMLGF